MSSLCEQINSSSFGFDCKSSKLFFQKVKQDQSSKDNLLKLFNADSLLHILTVSLK